MKKTVVSSSDHLSPAYALRSFTLGTVKTGPPGDELSLPVNSQESELGRGLPTPQSLQS